jgi:hypothetical protein
METKLPKAVASSYPKDRTLNAYKAWITKIAKRLTTANSELKFTEAEWLTYWKEFWNSQSHRVRQ